jgi:hypothetical protein
MTRCFRPTIAVARLRRHGELAPSPCVGLPMPAQVYIADSITGVGPEATGTVVVDASHGGVHAAYCAAKLQATAAIFNDAGVGSNRAGISGLDYLAAVGIAAATVLYDTARSPGCRIRRTPTRCSARAGAGCRRSVTRSTPVCAKWSPCGKEHAHDRTDLHGPGWPDPF